MLGVVTKLKSKEKNSKKGNEEQAVVVVLYKIDFSIFSIATARFLTQEGKVQSDFFSKIASDLINRLRKCFLPLHPISLQRFLLLGVMKSKERLHMSKLILLQFVQTLKKPNQNDQLNTESTILKPAPPTLGSDSRIIRVNFNRSMVVNTESLWQGPSSV
jgi:hypothetical protein